MSWFWATEDLEDITPDGGGICGGELLSVDLLLSSNSSTSSLAPQVILESTLQTDSQTTSDLSTTGFNIRSLISTSSSSCSIDVGNGLQVINEVNVVKNNVNKLKFSENLLVVTDVQNPPRTSEIQPTTLAANPLEVPSMIAVKQGQNWVMATWQEMLDWIGSTGGVLPPGTVTVERYGITVNAEYVIVS